MRRGTIIGRAFFCPVCKISNHAAKYTNHIECALKSNQPLRLSLARWTFILDEQTTIITTVDIL